MIFVMIVMITIFILIMIFVIYNSDHDYCDDHNLFLMMILISSKLRPNLGIGPLLSDLPAGAHLYGGEELQVTILSIVTHFSDYCCIILSYCHMLTVSTVDL